MCQNSETVTYFRTNVKDKGHTINSIILSNRKLCYKVAKILLKTNICQEPTAVCYFCRWTVVEHRPNCKATFPLETL